MKGVSCVIVILSVVVAVSVGGNKEDREKVKGKDTETKKGKREVDGSSKLLGIGEFDFEDHGEKDFVIAFNDENDSSLVSRVPKEVASYDTTHRVKEHEEVSHVSNALHNNHNIHPYFHMLRYNRKIIMHPPTRHDSHPSSNHLPKPYPVTVYKPVPYEVRVPVPKPFTVEKRVPVPIKVHIDRPYPVPVEKPYPVYVEKRVPYPVVRLIPYPVKVPVDRPVPYHVPVEQILPYPVEKKVPVPVEVPVERPVEYHIEKPLASPVEKPVLYPVEKDLPYLDQERILPYTANHSEHFPDLNQIQYSLQEQNNQYPPVSGHAAPYTEHDVSGHAAPYHTTIQDTTLLSGHDVLSHSDQSPHHPEDQTVLFQLEPASHHPQLPIEEHFKESSSVIHSNNNHVDLTGNNPTHVSGNHSFVHNFHHHHDNFPSTKTQKDSQFFKDFKFPQFPPDHPKTLEHVHNLTESHVSGHFQHLGSPLDYQKKVNYGEKSKTSDAFKTHYNRERANSYVTNNFHGTYSSHIVH